MASATEDENPVDGGDLDGQLAKSMMDCEEIAKSEDVRPQTRERARNVGLRLQWKHLNRNNPDAARQWIEQRTAR